MKIRERHVALMMNPALNGHGQTARPFVPGLGRLSGKVVRRWLKNWRRAAKE